MLFSLAAKTMTSAIVTFSAYIKSETLAIELLEGQNSKSWVQVQDEFDGEKVTIMQPHDYAAFVWIRANKTILGGTGVAWGMHLWTADTQTPASRQQWRNTLDQMIALHPQRVIPGHYLGTPPEGDSAVRFTKTYLQQFEQALKTHSDSAGVIKAMEAQWPGLAETSSLELSAKVNTGEMKW